MRRSIAALLAVLQWRQLRAGHQHFELLVNAITVATRGAAHAIGVDDARGTVTAGKIADLLIVDADPTTDIRNTRRIRFVIKDGRIVHTQAVAR